MFKVHYKTLSEFYIAFKTFHHVEGLILLSPMNKNFLHDFMYLN